MRSQLSSGPSGNPNASYQSQSLKAGDIAFARMEKVNAEVVAITYGALVTQIIADKLGDIGAVNTELDRMGYNMGIRLIDEFWRKMGSLRPVKVLGILSTHSLASLSRCF